MDNIIHFLKVIEFYTLKWVNFVVGKLHLKKKKLKGKKRLPSGRELGFLVFVF